MDWERFLYGYAGLALGRLEPQPGSLGPGTLGLFSPSAFLAGTAGRRALIIDLGGPRFIMEVSGLRIGVPGLMGGLASGVACLITGGLIERDGLIFMALPRGATGLVHILGWC